MTEKRPICVKKVAKFLYSLTGEQIISCTIGLSLFKNPIHYLNFMAILIYIPLIVLFIMDSNNTNGLTLNSSHNENNENGEIWDDTLELKKRCYVNYTTQGTRTPILFAHKLYNDPNDYGLIVDEKRFLKLGELRRGGVHESLSETDNQSEISNFKHTDINDTVTVITIDEKITEVQNHQQDITKLNGNNLDTEISGFSYESNGNNVATRENFESSRNMLKSETEKTGDVIVLNTGVTGGMNTQHNKAFEQDSYPDLSISNPVGLDTIQELPELDCNADLNTPCSRETEDDGQTVILTISTKNSSNRGNKVLQNDPDSKNTESNNLQKLSDGTYNQYKRTMTLEQVVNMSCIDYQSRYTVDNLKNASYNKNETRLANRLKDIRVIEGCRLKDRSYPEIITQNLHGKITPTFNLSMDQSSDYDLQNEVAIDVDVNHDNDIQRLVTDSKGNKFCTGAFENGYCWPYAPPKTQFYQRCTNQFHSLLDTLPDKFKHNYTYRICNADSTWGGVDTSDCINRQKVVGEEYVKSYYLPVIKNKLLMMKIMFAGSLVSSACLSISLIFMLCVPKLRKITRNRIHVQVFLSFMLRDLSKCGLDYVFYYKKFSAIANIASNKPYYEYLAEVTKVSKYYDFQSEPALGYICKTISISQRYFQLVGLYWIFIEAFYLHTLIIESFFDCRKYIQTFYIFAWITPMGSTVLYFIRKFMKDDSPCWLTDSDGTSRYFGIPRFTINIVNLVLFFNITYVIVKKLIKDNRQQAEIKRFTKRVAKAQSRNNDSTTQKIKIKANDLMSNNSHASNENNKKTSKRIGLSHSVPTAAGGTHGDPLSSINTSQMWRLAKAVLFLIPLFGIYDLIFEVKNVEMDAPMVNQQNLTWQIVNYVCFFLQGISISLIYFFFNSEVQYEIKRRFNRWKLVQNFSSTSNGQDKRRRRRSDNSYCSNFSRSLADLTNPNSVPKFGGGGTKANNSYLERTSNSLGVEANLHSNNSTLMPYNLSMQHNDRLWLNRDNPHNRSDRLEVANNLLSNHKSNNSSFGTLAPLNNVNNQVSNLQQRMTPKNSRLGNRSQNVRPDQEILIEQQNQQFNPTRAPLNSADTQTNGNYASLAYHNHYGPRIGDNTNTAYGYLRQLFIRRPSTQLEEEILLEQPIPIRINSRVDMKASTSLSSSMISTSHNEAQQQGLIQLPKRRHFTDFCSSYNETNPNDSNFSCQFMQNRGKLSRNESNFTSDTRTALPQSLLSMEPVQEMKEEIYQPLNNQISNSFPVSKRMDRITRQSIKSNISLSSTKPPSYKTATNRKASGFSIHGHNNISCSSKLQNYFENRSPNLSGGKCNNCAACQDVRDMTRQQEMYGNVEDNSQAVLAEEIEMEEEEDEDIFDDNSRKKKRIRRITQ